MIYLPLLILLPSLYLFFLAFRWMYLKEKSKKSRVHHTKRTIWLMLLAYLAIYLLHSYLFSVASSNPQQSYWLFSIIYYLAVVVVAIYILITIKVTKSKKNITKLMVVIGFLSLYLPLFFWSYQTLQIGVYDGKFGIAKKTAIELTDQHIGSGINHSYISATLDKDYWLVKESLRTFDSKTSIDVVYRVDLSNGHVSNNHSKETVPFKIVRPNGSGDSLEMMLFVDNSEDPKQPDLEQLQYANTNSEGNTHLSLKKESSSTYYLQVRDCSFSCTSYVFRVMPPVKESYDITIDPHQPLTEI